MSYEISVGPDQLTINAGECVLMTETDGQIRQPSERGLFWRDTRLVSTWTVLLNGRPPVLLSSAATAHFSAQVMLTNPALPIDEGGEVPSGTVSLSIGRLIGEGGLRETFTLRNHNRVSVHLTLTVAIGCDFADIFDVKSHRIVDRGDTVTTWDAAAGRVETVHTNGPFRRGLRVAPVAGAPVPSLRDGGLRFAVALAPQASWIAELATQVIDGDALLDTPDRNFAGRHEAAIGRALEAWRAGAMRIETPHAGLQRLYDQSLDDLAALRLPIASPHRQAFVPAAGIPWFAALFGRDTLITAIQTVPTYPDFARGALAVLAGYQADGFDDERDMQPGKIPHELRRGELAALGLVPYRPYYGTADATPLYLVLLHEAWRFTGDDGLIRQHRDTAERCLAWIDAHGDLDGDGFQEYRRLAPAGAENQGWKDSGNAVLDERGDDVPAPKALCELQGYVYDAWRRMALVFEALGETAKAATLRKRARDLQLRFDAAFWDEEASFYALCLDPAKRRVMSIASNAGHLLWSGIVPRARADAVVRRLMADDMWSGWGVRTLSADHPAYNPHDYQLGAIWPHDNGLIAIGLKHYGFHAEAARIAGGLVDAGVRFLLNRLPEVFAGTARRDSPFPVQYLGANVPQAWAAGAVFSLVRALVGGRVDPARGILYADPFLPDWLPSMTLRKLSVGPHEVDLRLWREDGRTRIAQIGGAPIRIEARPFGIGVEPH